MMSGKGMAGLRRALCEATRVVPRVARIGQRGMSSGESRKFSQPAKLHDRQPEAQTGGTRLQELRATLAAEQKTVEDFVSTAEGGGKGISLAEGLALLNATRKGPPRATTEARHTVASLLTTPGHIHTVG